MAKEIQNNDGRFKKGGYRPLNEGYSAKEERGYTPKAPSGNLPRPPQGGTGESSRPGSPATSQKHNGK